MLIAHKPKEDTIYHATAAIVFTSHGNPHKNWLVSRGQKFTVCDKSPERPDIFNHQRLVSIKYPEGTVYPKTSYYILPDILHTLARKNVIEPEVDEIIILNDHPAPVKDVDRITGVMLVDLEHHPLGPTLRRLGFRDRLIPINYLDVPHNEARVVRVNIPDRSDAHCRIEYRFLRSSFLDKLPVTPKNNIHVVSMAFGKSHPILLLRQIFEGAGTVGYLITDGKWDYESTTMPMRSMVGINAGTDSQDLPLWERVHNRGKASISFGQISSMRIRRDDGNDEAVRQLTAAMWVDRSRLMS